MIIVGWNEVIGGIDLMVDAAGVDLLIDRLVKLKNENKNHLHVYDVGMTSPWGHTQVAKEVVITWLGEPDIFEEK